jgi:hypothetical protein
VRRDGREAEGGGLENRFTRNRDGGSNPSPSVFIFNLFYKNDKITLTSEVMRRGAGVADQGRLLSDCAD